MAASRQSGLIPCPLFQTSEGGRHSGSRLTDAGSSLIRAGEVPPRTGGGIDYIEGFKEFKGFARVWKQIL